MILDIKLKIGDRFYFIDYDSTIKSGRVDKVEVFSDYFRYVNEDSACCINWFVNDSLDNDLNPWPVDGAYERMFTSEKLATNSHRYKMVRASFLQREIEGLIKELNEIDTKEEGDE